LEKYWNNEWEQDFYKFQKHTKGVINSLLKEVLSGNKNNGVLGGNKQKITDKHEKMVKGRLLYWSDILDRMYDQETADYIKERVLDQVYKEKKNNKIHSKKSFRTNQTIDYEAFVKIVMRFQLDKHWILMESMFKTQSEKSEEKYSEGMHDMEVQHVLRNIQGEDRILQTY